MSGVPVHVPRAAVTVPPSRAVPVTVGGATGASYAPAAADVGHALRVVVTATNAAGSRSATSDATAAVDAVAPSVRTAPSIDGTVRDGGTLVADPGTWDGTQPIAFAYQWRRCDAAGGGCTAITGATGRAYAATADDVGGTLRVAVTASNRGGADTATSAPTGRVAASAPVNTAAPRIDGAPRDGQTLTADPGAWDGTAPVSFTYQWRRCDATGADCRDIDGATDAAYAATPADVGHAVLVLVTGRNDGGTPTAASAPTPAVAAQAPENTATPGVSGPVADGGTLTADDGEWTGTPAITFTYQWERCDAQGAACAAITGATGRTHDLNDEEIGRTLRVAVTAHNAGGTATATSATTAPVAAVAPRTSDGPTVAGDDRAGATLTADAGTWAGTQPITLAYQWQRCHGTCTDIPGADGTTYDTVAEDVRANVRVVVTATNAAGTARAESPGLGPIRAVPPTNTARPTITGIAADGATLIAAQGTWSGTPPIDFAYRWQRCDTDGASCDAIPDAVEPTYRPTADDVGHTIRVVVTATNPGGRETAPSAATATVLPTPPANTVRPSVSGTPHDGETLSADTGDWTGTAPLAFTYRWQRCDASGDCRAIAGATDATYTATSADARSTLQVVVTATNDAGSASAASPRTAAVAAVAPANTTAPSIAGAERVGELLAADHGDWTGTGPLTYAYAWQRCDARGASCDPIAGATGGNYALTPADEGRTLRLVVTASGPGGDASRTTETTGVIAAALPQSTPPVNTVPATIAGDAREGSALTVVLGTWTGTAPITRDFQWRRCDASGDACVDIDGATGMTRTATADDVGHTLRVLVTAHNVAGDGTATTSPTDVVVPRGPASTSAPSVSGSVRIGDDLTADRGDWTGTPDISYAYQWQRCASATTCVDIAGAASRTYTTTGDDVGAALRVQVTATNTAGRATAVSDRTAAITADPPRNETTPEVIGTARVGETLAVDQGSWSGTDPLTFSYQWQRCDAAGDNCAPVAGQTERMYALTGADQGGTIRVVVTASGPGGVVARATDATAAVAPASSDPIPDPPNNEVAPTITGSARSGNTLQVERGHWTGTDPIAYTYRWQRCDGDGTNCVDIDGATSLEYALTDDDVGHTLRIVARGTNAAGTSSVISTPTAVVGPAGTTSGGGGNPRPVPAPSPTPSPTPSPPTPATPAAPSAGTVTGQAPAAGADLSSLPGSQVSSASCAALVGGGGFRRITFAPAGAVRMRVRADAAVLPTAPVRVTVNASKAAGLRSVRYTLDGRALRAATRAPYTLGLAPAALRPGRHVLAASLRPSRGRARVLRTTLRVAACATLFTARQYRTTSGSALRLRIDSRTATTAATFALPAAVTRALGLGTPAGRIRVVTPTGARRYRMTPARGRRPTGLSANPAGRPSVRIRGRTVVVTGLPARTGIIDVTVYQPRAPRGPALLARNRRVNAVATIRAPGTQRIAARVSRSGG